MKKLLTAALAIALSSPLLAQHNVFLDAKFWSANPSVATLDQKIKEGHNIAEANANNFDGVTLAILQNAPLETIVYAIAQKGNDVNKLTHDGRTYIFWAANKGNVELVQYLINNGAKTNITDDKGSTIINFAAGSGQANTKVYDLLIAQGADLKKDLTLSGANALLLAAPYDTDFSLINYFMSKGLDINSTDHDGNGVFNYAARTGNISLMDQLLKKGIKGNDNAFIFASQGARGITNKIEVYNYLEQVGLRPTAVSNTGNTALHALAARGKDLEVIKYFIDRGADVNQPDTLGNTPFMNAAGQNSLEVVRLFSKSLKNINHTNKKGVSALALATANNSPEVVDYLLQLNADPLITDSNGNDLTTYLMQSYQAENEAAFMAKLKHLQQQGFVFGKPQAHGNTLYHLALAKNELAALHFIERFNGDINAKNNEGNTPLHLAAMQANDTEILRYLVTHGAQKEIATDFDETAYDLAMENELLTKQQAALDFLK